MFVFQIPDMLSIIGLVTLFFSAFCLASEFALHRRLPNCLKTCFGIIVIFYSDI